MSCPNTEGTIETDECNMINCESETGTFKNDEKVDNAVGNTIDKDVSQKVTEKLQEMIENEKKQELDPVETTNSLEDMRCKNVVSEQETAQTDLELSTENVSGKTDAQASETSLNESVVNSATGDQVSSTFSEALVEDMSILEISEKNNKNIQSNVVVNHQTDSLKNLLSYESSSDESDESDFETDWQVEVINDTESADSSEDSESDLCPVYIKKHPDKGLNNKPSEKNMKNQKEQSALYSFEELDRFNLPPLPDLSNLNIDYENEEFLHIGHVKAIVESLVTIEAVAGSPSYDLDTILFVDDQTIKKPLGAIYDVIGPVACPIYCIRMKNEEELQEKGVKLNMKVYSAPKSKYTQYVFVAELRKLKGTDASWLDDREMPHGVDDSSGDELASEPDPPVLKRKRDSLERHQRFEKTMNRCNSIHTRVARLMDQHRVPRSSPVISNVASSPEVIPAFNPAVPPPNYVDLRAVLPFPNPVPAPQQFQQFPNPRHPSPRMWHQQDSHQGRNQRRYDRGMTNWNHHAGPSRGHGQY